MGRANRFFNPKQYCKVTLVRKSPPPPTELDTLISKRNNNALGGSNGGKGRKRRLTKMEKEIEDREELRLKFLLFLKKTEEKGADDNDSNKKD